jgi:hypothetical protein
MPNYILLERVELNASAASVTFANIPQSGYTDLKVVMSTRAVDSANNWYLTKIQFNTDTTSGNYSARILAGFGSTAFSATSSNYAGYIPSAARTANTFGNNEIYIPNYLGSTAKSYSTDSVTEGNGASFEILGLWAGLWSGTAAINQVVLSPDTGSWAANSTFSLYGVAALGTTPVIAPKASGGNIENDGTYWYHTFLTTGAFVPQTGLTCDVLQVAGGGGGGSGPGAGGGGGGLLAFTNQALAAINYTVTIGAGGAGGASGTSSTGTQGNNSQFGSLTASVGGGFGAAGGNGGNGGSGGGAAPNGVGGTATSGQGFDGGSVTVGGAGSFYMTASGGGGGAAGTTPTGGACSPGGVGATSAFINSIGSATGNGQTVSGTTYFAGGGGGGNAAWNNGAYAEATPGAGGLGGGGAGANRQVTRNATNAVANMGGGGGGGAYYFDGTNNRGSGAAGGSGIVVIRYTIA